MNAKPIIVVTGPPRSGTSLLMQMLQAGGIEPLTDGERAADDDNPRGYFEHRAILALARDTAILEQAQGKAVKIIHILLQHIPQHLPLAVLFLNRNLDEVLDSQATMLKHLSKPADRLPRATMRRTLETQVQQAKKQLETRPQTHVLDIEHRTLIQQPDVAAQSIANFLNQTTAFSVAPAAMAAQVDPALHHHHR